MKRYLQTLIALIILGALWGSFYYYGKRQAEETPKAESKQDKLLPVASGEVQSFTVKSRDGESFTCAREGGGWNLVDPHELPADSDAVSSWVGSLTSANVSEVIDAHPADLKPYGLDDPDTTIDVVTTRKGGNYELKIGDDTPTGGGIYAQVGGNPRVVTLASYLKTSLEKTPFDLRDKRAVTIDLDLLKQIRVASKKTSYTLEKNPEGVWNLVLPPAVRADQVAVDGLIRELQRLTMRSVVAEDKNRGGNYGFSSPTLTVELKGPDANQELVLGRTNEKESGRHYAMNSALSPVFTLDSSLPSQLEKQPGDLRDKGLFTFSTFEAKRLEIMTPAGRWVFERQGDKWNRTAPSVKDEPRDKMDDLVGSLHDLRAESFPQGLSVSSAGLAKPEYHFEVTFGDKNEKETVEASKAGGHVYARRPSDPVPAEISKDALASIEKALAKL